MQQNGDMYLDKLTGYKIICIPIKSIFLASTMRLGTVLDTKVPIVKTIMALVL
jgi:hypothetical protein